MKRRMHLQLSIVVLIVLALAIRCSHAETLGLANTPGLVKIKAHKSHVMGIAFSPGGKVLASAGLDGMICLWDPITGKEIRKFQAHKEGVFSIAFSPDGKVLASSGAEPVIRFWDPATGQEVRQLKGHTDKVASIAFSPDGKILASGSYDKTIRLWASASGQEVRQLVGHSWLVTTLAFSPNGKQLVSGGVTGEPIKPPAGGMIVSGWADNLRLWEVQSGKQLRKFEAKGFNVGFSPDGRTIAAGGLVARIEPDTELPGRFLIFGVIFNCLVDSNSGELLRETRWRGSAVAFSPNGMLLATGSGSTVHTRGFGSMVGGRPEEQKLADYRLCVWETMSGQPIGFLPEDYPIQIAFSPKTRYVAASNYDGHVLLCDLWTYGMSEDLRPSKLSPQRLKTLWNELGAADAKSGHRAVWILAAVPEQALPILKDGLKVSIQPQEKRVRDLLADLADTRFSVRDAAAKELKMLGRGIEPVLRQSLEAHPQLDTRRLLDQILGDVRSGMPSSDELRALRAIQLLEQIGSPEACEVLKRLASGSPYALSTQHAKAALERGVAP